MRYITRHARWFTQQRMHRHIHSVVVEQAIAHDELAFRRGGTNHRKRATLTLTQCGKTFDIFGGNGQYITFLRFITPQLGWAHARIFALNGTQLEAGTDTPRVSQFRHGI